MKPQVQNPNYRVVLIGNYLPDQQFSMQRFAQLLQLGLSAQGVDVELILPPVVFGKLCSKNNGVSKYLGYVDKFLLFPFLLRSRIRSISSPCIVHICDHSNAPYTKWLTDLPHLVTCHDLLAIRSALGEFPENRTQWMGRQLQAMILRGLKRARSITSVSSATRDDVTRIVGRHPSCQYVIPNALNASFIHEANQALTTVSTEERAVEGRYVMHIGSGSWYKNRAAVLRIFSKLSNSIPDLKLVVIGPEYTDKALVENGCETLASKLFYLKDIDDDALQNIYKHAELLLFPSLIEGFGWPILEAQACGCSVLTLDRAPMNELNASPSLMIDADDSPQWEDRATLACSEAINSPAPIKDEQQLQLKAFALKFSLERIIPQYLELYEAQLNTDS